MDFVFPSTTTYAVFVYCVNNTKSEHCLTTPSPLEVYGPTPEGGQVNIFII